MVLHPAKSHPTRLTDNGAVFIGFKTIPLDCVVVGKRIRDDPTIGIDLLVNSIKALGLLHPIVVRQQEGNGKQSYLLLAGERRVEAFKRMGRSEIPAHIHFNSLGKPLHEGMQ